MVWFLSFIKVSLNTKFGEFILFRILRNVEHVNKAATCRCRFKNRSVYPVQSSPIFTGGDLPITGFPDSL